MNYAGYISIKNLRRVCKELGETIDDSELQEMVERADTDNDGLVSEEEFYNIITKKTFSWWYELYWIMWTTSVYVFVVETRQSNCLKIVSM